MPFALAPLIIQYGLPAGIKGIEFLIELLSAARNDPNMTQEEFASKVWAPMQEKYKDDWAAWDQAGQSPQAKA